MTVPWVAEVDFSPQVARQLLQQQFPELPVEQIILLGVGWDNFAFLVDNEFVFRFPRRKLGAELLDNEIRLLPKLVPLVPLPIPNPLFIGQPTEQYPWKFAGYRRLPGRTACQIPLTDEQRTATIPMLAHFLAALHSLPATWGFQNGAPNDTLGRLDPVRRIPQAHDRIAQQYGGGEQADRNHSLVEELGHARRPQANSIVHGDLYLRHILINDQCLPCGVIDWGDIHVGDVALDLSIAFTFLPASSREAFRREYGKIEDDTWQLARFRALSYGLVLTEYSRSVNDHALMREAHWIMQSILED